MPTPPVLIRPRRSMVFFAILAILMVILSYVILVLLAAICVVFPYLMLLSGHGNFQVLLIFLFGVAIAGALLWSLVPRRDKFVPPGPLLHRADHPRLFQELDRIAASLGEGLPREVYLIPDMNAFVADRGGILGFGSHRIMGLGLPLLSILSISEFRAILAHEFAHYYGGDTSLGPWVYKARSAIIRVFKNVGSLGKLARFWVLAIMYMVITTILKWYFEFFLTITNQISRQQEFRADELACIVAGPQPLIDGLRAINGAGPAWPTYWKTEVAPLLNDGAIPGIGDGFARFVASPAIAKQIDNILGQQLLKAKSDPYDTHPVLRDRIAAAAKLPSFTEQRETLKALSLLENVPQTELKFVQALSPRYATAALLQVTWDHLASSVTLPTWKRTLETYGKTLDGYTAARLPDAVGKLRDIGREMRDPKGTLLTPEQRLNRAADLLGVALGLSLVNNGWQLHVQPGEFDLKRGEDTLNPYLTIQGLLSGELTGEAWQTKCQQLQISDLPLASAALLLRP